MIALLYLGLGRAFALEFTAVSSMNSARSEHTATALTDGRVLVAGGKGIGGTLASVEVLNAAGSAWIALPPMLSARTNHTATRLPDGRVLVAGGALANALSTAEVFDPVSNSWSAVSAMSNARTRHTATLLPDGRVLLIGGEDVAPMNSAEVFDATTSLWSVLPAMSAPRSSHTSTLLADGTVLVVGGNSTSAQLKSTERYSPAANTWMPAPALNNARQNHRAALLSTGSVLVSGGNSTVGNVTSALSLDERLDVSPNTWVTFNAIPFFPSHDEGHSLTVMVDGRVIQFGGYGFNGYASSSGYHTYDSRSATYAASDGAWTLGPAVSARAFHATAVHVSGDVLIIGGRNASGAFSDVYRLARSRTSIAFSGELNLPLLPISGQQYSISVVVNIPVAPPNAPTGNIVVSDGTASCTVALPATSCVITTATPGAKSLSATYLGDINFMPAVSTYAVVPKVVITRSGSSSVGVSSSPSGISCFGGFPFCTSSFSPGALVTLTAFGQAAASNIFTGWLGRCIGAGPCTFQMPTDTHVRVEAVGGTTLHQPYTLDVDRDGRMLATTDGMLVNKFMNGSDAYYATWIPNDALGPPGGSFGAYLAGMKPMLDIDGDGSVIPETDGILIVRYMLGMRGSALIENAIGSLASRTSATAIEAHLRTLGLQ